MKKRVATVPFAALFVLFLGFASRPADAASFKSVMKRHEPEFQRCYEEELGRSKKKTTGRINLRITIDRTGKVIESGPTKNTTRSRFLADCLVRAVEKIPFGKRKKDREIHVHPFKFALPKRK